MQLYFETTEYHINTTSAYKQTDITRDPDIKLYHHLGILPVHQQRDVAQLACPLRGTSTKHSCISKHRSNTVYPSPTNPMLSQFAAASSHAG